MTHSKNLLCDYSVEFIIDSFYLSFIRIFVFTSILASICYLLSRIYNAKSKYLMLKVNCYWTLMYQRDVGSQEKREWRDPTYFMQTPRERGSGFTWWRLELIASEEKGLEYIGWQWWFTGLNGIDIMMAHPRRNHSRLSFGISFVPIRPFPAEILKGLCLSTGQVEILGSILQWWCRGLRCHNVMRISSRRAHWVLSFGASFVWIGWKLMEIFKDLWLLGE